MAMVCLGGKRTAYEGYFIAILKRIIGLNKGSSVMPSDPINEKKLNYSTFQEQAQGPPEYSELENRIKLMR